MDSNASRTQALHQSDADEDDENVKQLNDCSSIYLSLQDCLVKTDRNWKSCQKQVQALKLCNERRLANKNDGKTEALEKMKQERFLPQEL